MSLSVSIGSRPQPRRGFCVGPRVRGFHRSGWHGRTSWIAPRIFFSNRDSYCRSYHSYGDREFYSSPSGPLTACIAVIAILALIILLPLGI